MRLRKKDRKSSFFLACLGIFTAVTAYRLGLGPLTNPGPGFLPFIGGLMMILLSVIGYLQALSPSAEGEKELIRIGNRKILLSAICFILYAFFFRRVGFIVANFLLLTFLFQLLERKSWFVSAFVSAATIFVSYLIFAVWLKVQLPKGFLGF